MKRNAFTCIVLGVCSCVGALAQAENQLVEQSRVTPSKPIVAKRALSNGLPIGKDWSLVWNEEFDGTSVDEARWNRATENPSWVHPSFKTRFSEANCAVDGRGHLVIRLTREADGTIGYHPGLQTRNFQRAFGYVETRVQFTTQPGWWGSVCLIRNNSIPNYGHDTFESPQEFDIFEDFHKPKVEPTRPVAWHNTISQAYHATVMLGFQDQGDGSGAIRGNDSRKRDMAAVSKISRVLRVGRPRIEGYTGWHTVGLQWSPLEQIFYVDGQETFRQSYKDTPVTTVPLRVLIVGCLRTPAVLRKDGGALPFYGWLEDATLPDQLVVDYVRWYDVDVGDKKVPAVTVTLDGNPVALRHGQPVTLRIRAEDSDGAVKAVYLFAKGYIRAEMDVDSSQIDQTFTVGNLFEGDNTIIAMARDNDGFIGISVPLRITLPAGIGPE
jgi:hypothetical protein